MASKLSLSCSSSSRAGMPSLFSSNASLTTSSVLTRPSPLSIARSRCQHNQNQHQHQQKRTQATSRRLTKRLRVAPARSAPQPHDHASSHTPASSLPGFSRPTGATTLTFDPPSSAPTTFHTPSIFLPEGDPRRTLFATPSAGSSISNSQQSSSSSSPTATTAMAMAARHAAHRNPYAANPSRTLPPEARPAPASSGRHHLTEENLREMRALRAEDPKFWTRRRLAEKFDCSEMFVAIGAPAAREQGEAWWARQRAVTDRSGPKRRKARQDMVKRKELWYSDA